MKPVITVGMPVYNAAKYLREAVESVLKQDCPCFELIICDDGSADGSYQIALGLARKDQRIRLVRNMKNQGVPAARNKILKLARGKYFAPHDADDIMLAGRLRIQKNILERHSEVGVVFGHALMMRSRWRNRTRPLYASISTFQGAKSLRRTGTVKSYPFIPHCSAMFRTLLAKDAGGYAENLITGEDANLFRKMWRRMNFYCLNRYFYIYRLHERSLTAPCIKFDGEFDRSKFIKTLPSPRVTVAIPVYNGARHLADSLESVLNQDFVDFELIVYDDGSSDNSFDIAKTYEQTDPRVRAYRADANRGVAHARNEILKRARSPYIALQDADDIMLAGRLKAQVEALERHPEAGLVCGHNFVVRGRDRKIESSMKVVGYKGEKGFFLKKSGMVRCRCWFPTGSVMFRKKEFLRVGGYNETMEVGSDQDLFRRMEKITRFYFLDRYAYIYRLHNSSLTQTHERQKKREMRDQERRANRRRLRFNRCRKKLAFNWHGGQFEILSERSHYLDIIKKNLSYYTNGRRCSGKGIFGRISIEVRYRNGNEPDIHEELSAPGIKYLKLRRMNYFFAPEGKLKIFILNNHEKSDSWIYHCCFLFPIHEWIQRTKAILVHGALLGVGRTGTLIVGHDGAGKSTLAAMLVMAGFQYFSDEHPILREDGATVKGLAFINNMGIIPISRQHLSGLGQRLSLNKKTGKYIFKPWEIGANRAGNECEVETILFPDFASGKRLAITKLTGREIFKRLLKDVYAVSDPRSPKGLFHAGLFKKLAWQAKGFSIQYGEKDAKKIVKWVINREREQNA